jgi:hypothetical protein
VIESMDKILSLKGQQVYGMKGKIRVYPEGRPDLLLYSADNVITLTVKSLFARLMMASSEPENGIWGLALGTGNPSWGSTTQPTETSTQTALITQVLRKPLSQTTFVDTNYNPIATYNNMVSFQTTINATTDGITAVQLREMGLIGGGTTVVANGGPTNMLTAPYWNPSAPVNNSVTLINYKTLPPLILPPGINVIFNWVITF